MTRFTRDFVSSIEGTSVGISAKELSGGAQIYCTIPTNPTGGVVDDKRLSKPARAAAGPMTVTDVAVWRPW